VAQGANRSRIMSKVLAERRGQLGLITLNRPEALNALDLEMIDAIGAALHDFAAEPLVQSVAIISASAKAFCAGGDVRAAVTARPEQAATFFRHEYRLNYAIATYEKPLFAIVDGLCMGGGLGLSVHAKHCLVTENALMAMPEMAIGLFPDVGGGSFLNRHSLELGLFIALTGARLDAGDALYAHLANGYLPAANIYDLLSALEHGRPFAAFLAPAPEGQLASQNLEVHLERLHGSPTSMRITIKHLTESRGQDLKAILSAEYRLACACLRGNDFKEGVRAMLIDKDKQPKWHPPTLAGVSDINVRLHWAEPFGPELFDTTV